MTFQAATAEELRALDNQFKTESGCPVQVVSAKTLLEIDPIGAPMACRIYIDYKNTSERTVSGVKFKIGYIDSEENIRGTFHAPDGHQLAPGATASAKWRGDKVDPRTARVMIRVLVARYADGSSWESDKLKGLAPGTGGSSSTAGGSPSGTGQAGGDSFESESGQAPPGSSPSGSDKSTDGY